ncbi:MAG TPA: CAP domain-containing protein, partial [Terriglobales bacterium]|nr:CAP domain-containing protein [Terriglobales bacterium]
NAERSRAGLPPLKTDDGLARAARAHAAEMASQEQLSHQFSGEPSLNQRISASSSLHLDRTGENVAMATTADDAHAALMSSPPHRDNLLSRNFNVAGIGVVRKGTRLYVAQDFGTSLATYSVKQAQELVSASVEQLRAQAEMPKLQRVDNRSMQSSACAMAQADSLNAASPSPGSYMLRYTSTDPEKLPASISKVIAQRGLHAYSAGTCYARTQKYPNGAYWVVLVFY